MQTPKEILLKYWGYSSFRENQEEIIKMIINNKDTLALLPTGGGKSICYQIPSLIMDGICIVVSP
ncbi:MAG: DEAD/DEAH box helicase, partial [Flavobacteriales bacterium]|nr:DEAD/DEAH box helicase [Flavobacteriales bacterium]